MREILFRGKRLDNGEWVDGVFFPKTDKIPATIFFGQHNAQGVYVDPATVGQFVGLLDKNGKQIFEGDVVEYEDAEADFEGYHDNVFANRGTVTLTPWGGVSFTNRQSVEMDDLYDSETSIDAEVIGNIYDNPEMLEGGATWI